MRHRLAGWILAVALGITACPGTFADDAKVRGLRVDPGQLYGLPGFKPEMIARTLVDDVVACRANTLLIFADSPTFGAFYKTTYPDAEVEKGLGGLDFLRQVLNRAHPKGLRVVASLPVNNFKSVWANHTAWRSKTREGKDYKPDGDSFFLSAWSAGFRDWLKGFADDLLRRYPDLDGIEAVEGLVDKRWDGQPDFNPEAVGKFKAFYPSESPGGSRWRQFRAAGMTDLHEILATAAHARRKTAHVVQTLAARPDGSLFEFREIRDGAGFDFDGVSGLAGAGRPDDLAAELIWQQWLAEYKQPAIFTPDWTGAAAREFARRVGGRLTPIVHVEVTSFPPGHPTVVPSGDQFERTVRLALGAPGGVTVYEYTLIKKRGLLDRLKGAFGG
jgi:hypothetical protein